MGFLKCPNCRSVQLEVIFTRAELQIIQAPFILRDGSDKGDDSARRVRIGDSSDESDGSSVVYVIHTSFVASVVSVVPVAGAKYEQTAAATRSTAIALECEQISVEITLFQSICSFVRATSRSRREL